MKRVLVVDDSIVATRQLEKIIGQAAGFMCIGRARDGSEAIRMNHSENPDVIIMELNMPGMDGLTALRCLTAMDKEVKVVITSSMASTGSRLTDAIKLGACCTIVKPFVAQDVLHSLQELV